jgi:two-component system, NtrC family, sensor kinase
MRMRILHLESEPGYTEIAEKALRQGSNDIVYLCVQTKEECTKALDSGEHDVLLTASSFAPFTSLHTQYPQIPVIVWAETEEERQSFQNSISGVWEVLLRSEIQRLPFAVVQAAEHSAIRMSHAALEGELSQAKDVLLNCQKSIALGRLLGSIAHEINNPLEAISNLIYLAQRTIREPEKLSESLDLAGKELQRVGEITKQMLSFHRDARDMQEVLVTEVLESVLALYEARIRQRQIDVVRQYRNVGSLAIYPGELRQILSNLIANAIDALPPDGRLILRVQERRSPHPRLCITVADTGSGMSREETARIGELFFTTKGESGTGLGMWVTRKLIAKHDGSIQAYSSKAPGRSGTVFHLCFKEPRARFEKSEESENATVTLKPLANVAEGGLPDGDGVENDRRRA